MERYDVVGMEPSIVQPGFMDVELFVGGHLKGFVRLPADFAEKINGQLEMFHLRDDTPIAYRAAHEVYYFPIVPKSLAHAQVLMRGMPDMFHGSLDSVRLNYAMMKAMRARGAVPSLFVAKNFWDLSHQKSR